MSIYLTVYVPYQEVFKEQVPVKQLKDFFRLEFWCYDAPTFLVMWGKKKSMGGVWNFWYPFPQHGITDFFECWISSFTS